MTREEAVKIIKKWLMEGTYGITENRLGYIEGWFHKEDAEAFEMAIKALEQKPILDKIRAEIEQITDTVGVSCYPKEKFMKKWNKPEIIEVTKKEVTAKVESLTPEQIHAAAVKIGEERIKNEKRSN